MTVKLARAVVVNQRRMIREAKRLIVLQQRASPLRLMLPSTERQLRELLELAPIDPLYLLARATLAKARIVTLIPCDCRLLRDAPLPVGRVRQGRYGNCARCGRQMKRA